MGGRTATLLIAGSACAAVLVLGWSLLASLSIVEATPYWLGSIGVIAALGAAFLILKDLVLWPFRFFGPRLSTIIEKLTRWLSSFAPAGRRTSPPPANRARQVKADTPRRQH